MDKPDFINNIKEKFSIMKDKVVTWIKGNKKLSLIIVSLICIMLVCIILLIIISSKNKLPKDKVYEEKLILSQELLVPNGPELPRDYTISRETKEKWTDEEAESWFTVPSEKEIEGLSKSNDIIIDEVLGVAP